MLEGINFVATQDYDESNKICKIEYIK